MARLGRLEEAGALAMDAVGHAEGTQFLGFHADALLVQAEVRRLVGRRKEAAAALAEARALWERKGDAVSAARASTMLERLR